jgi:chromosome partitioning protein
MKTIAVNSIKGGTGKSTLAIVLVNALAEAGYKCLVIDADASNNSMSFHIHENPELEMIRQKNVFSVFMGGTIPDNVIKISEHIDLLHGDVRLNEFRSTDSLKRLKRALGGLDYDFVIIDTSPTYDNIIGNVLTASDILLIPVLQDVFSYQALRYQFEKLADLELDDLDTHIVFNQFEKPRTDNQDAYRNQITNLIMNDEMFKTFVSPNRISKSSVFRKYINKQNYQIGEKAETQKSYVEIKSLISSILGITIKEVI